MKFRATVAIFLLPVLPSSPSSPRHPSPSVSFRFANKIHSTAGGAIEKARRRNTVKATIIVGDIENFSSLVPRCTPREPNFTTFPPPLAPFHIFVPPFPFLFFLFFLFLHVVVVVVVVLVVVVVVVVVVVAAAPFFYSLPSKTFHAGR